MSEQKKAHAPPTLRLRADETDSLFSLYASLQELDSAKVRMEKRLRSIPNAWRDISLVRSVLSKLIDRLLETIPYEKLLSLQRNMRYMSYRVYFARPVTTPENETIISGEDMRTLVTYAHDYHCTGCDKDCNRCKLGKTLDHVMIQCRKHNESWSWIDYNRDYDDNDAMSVE